MPTMPWNQSEIYLTGGQPAWLGLMMSLRCRPFTLSLPSGPSVSEPLADSCDLSTDARSRCHSESGLVLYDTLAASMNMCAGIHICGVRTPAAPCMGMQLASQPLHSPAG